MATVRVTLSQNKVALVDEEDAARVLSFKWYAQSRGDGLWYASRNCRRDDGSIRVVYLHRFILDPPSGVPVDHRNGDGLDCRRANLRVASPSTNLSNRRKQRRNGAPFKGIYRSRSGRCWVAWITVDRKPRYLGHFARAEDAARAYDDAAREHYGEFACVNFPREGERGAT